MTFAPKVERSKSKVQICPLLRRVRGGGRQRCGRSMLSLLFLSEMYDFNNKATKYSYGILLLLHYLQLHYIKLLLCCDKSGFTVTDFRDLTETPAS